MKTLLANFQLFITIGMIVIMYFWLMSWSIKWFVNFKITCKQPNIRFDWQEIVSIPVYILTWGPFILIGIAFIGGFFYLMYELLMSMIAIIP